MLKILCFIHKPRFGVHYNVLNIIPLENVVSIVTPTPRSGLVHQSVLKVPRSMNSMSGSKSIPRLNRSIMIVVNLFLLI